MTGYRCPRCSAIASGDPATLVCARCGFPGPPHWPNAEPPQSLERGRPAAAPGGAEAGWPSPGPGSDDRTLGLLAHVLGIVTGFLGPLVLMLVKGKESPFVDRHARAALDYHVTVAIVAVAFWVLFILVAVTALLPFFFLLLIPLVLVGALAIGIATIAFGAMGAMAAHRGEEYRYPIAFRMLERR